MTLTIAADGAVAVDVTMNAGLDAGTQACMVAALRRLAFAPGARKLQLRIKQTKTD